MPKLALGTIVREAKAPAWLNDLKAGTYKPCQARCKWDIDLMGYETWHDTGCTTEKAKSPDGQNWAETVAAVCRWVREAHISQFGNPRPCTRDEYWDLAAWLSRVTVTRFRAAQSLPVLESRNVPHWAAYCFMQCLQCLYSERDTPVWFVKQLDAHVCTRIRLKDEAMRYLAIAQRSADDYAVITKWMSKDEKKGRFWKTLCP